VAVGPVAASGGALGTAAIVVVFYGALANTTMTLSASDSFDAGDIAIANMASSATTVPLVPILGSQFNHYLVTTAQADLGAASALTRFFNYSLQVNGRAQPFYPMNTSNNGTYAGTVENKPTTQVQFSVGAGDNTDMALLANLRANDTIFVRNKAVGTTIESTLTYLFQIDQAIKLNGVGAITSGDGGLAQINFQGVLVHDGTWGRGLSILARNTLTAL